MAAMEAFSAGEQFDSVLMDRDRFVAFSFCTADLLIELDPDRQVTFAAGAVRAILGCAPDEIVGKRIRTVVAAVDRVMVEELLNKMRDYGALEEALIRLRTEKGPTERLALSGYYLDELGGRFYLTLRRKVTKAIQLKDKDVDRDDETGLLRAANFVDIATEKLEELGDQYQLSTVQLDEADDLRSRLNIDQRAELQAAIGATLRANSAGGELAGDLGDDKFALIHHKSMDVGTLEKRIADQSKEIDPTGVGLIVHAAKVATENASAVSAEEATKALILAVKSLDELDGELDIEKLSQNLTSMVADTTRQMGEIRSVIDDGSFVTVFQPVVKLRDGSGHHFEALTRFDKNDLSLSPFKFIRMAEDVGLVEEFDLLTCQRALEHLVGETRTHSHLPIAVNLSGRSLNSDIFIDRLNGLLDGFENVRRRLMIEITETVRLKDFKRARSCIQDLRQKGHKVCLDDFGAGEMQIEYLKELEVDFVKIDGSYIQAAEKDPTQRVLLKAITGMCREMQVPTIAEMLEDRSMLPFLRDCGVLLGQGYLYGRPQPEPVYDQQAALENVGADGRGTTADMHMTVVGAGEQRDTSDDWRSLGGGGGEGRNAPTLTELARANRGGDRQKPGGGGSDAANGGTEMQW